MITIIVNSDSNEDILIDYLYDVLIKQKQLCEVIIANEYIMRTHNIRRLPSTILSNGKVIEREEMERYVNEANSNTKQSKRR